MNISEVNDDFFQNRISECINSGDHEKAAEWEQFRLNLHQSRENTVQFEQEQYGRFCEKLDASFTNKTEMITEIEIERKRRRSRIVEIFAELLDEEILDRRTSDTLYDLLKNALQRGEVLEVEINSSPYGGALYARDFDLPSIAMTRCFESRWVFLKKQVRYMDVDLKGWDNWLRTYDALGTYVCLTKDILVASKQFNPYLEDIRSKGFTVSVDYNYRSGQLDAPKAVIFIR